MGDMEYHYMTTAEAADYLRIKPDTLKVWRHRSTGPRYFKPSPGLVRYRRQDLDAWIELQEADQEASEDE
tara:strand:- start:493 stop:702 length:210 start_codon:yes stop_codon:yes gene_type:complete